MAESRGMVENRGRTGRVETGDRGRTKGRGPKTKRNRINWEALQTEK